MHTTISERTYRAIYRLLDRVSPVDYDCGTLCNSICCTFTSADIVLQEVDSSQLPTYNAAGNAADPVLDADGPETVTAAEEELGIYLYPGEERLFTMQEDWLAWEIDDASWYDFPDSWEGDVCFVRCLKAPRCDRPKRPLQCRFYPAAPHVTEDGELILIRATAATPYECPLIAKKTRLNESFLKATHTVCTHMARDPWIMDLFEYDSEYRREDPNFDEEAARLWPIR